MTMPLSDDDRARYAWQIDTPGFGEAGQQRLRDSAVLISRCGGLGSVVAYELAAAGVGHLVIAHGGDIKPSDMNRQLLNRHDHLGKRRIDSIVSQLAVFNPTIRVTPIAQNVSEALAEEVVPTVDAVVDAAPLFEERFAMNDACVRHGKPMVECAMHDTDATVFSVRPGVSACLRCVCPEAPAWWTRRFPVFGATSGTAGCLGAMECIKLLTGFGEPLLDRVASVDLKSMRLRTVAVQRDPSCVVCGGV